MLKTIKTTKQMRLDELIKYCIENEIEDEKFKIGGSKNKIVPKGLGFGVEKNFDYKEFSVSRSGIFTVTGDVNKSDLFPVEVEEPITKETKFDTIFAITVEEDRDISYADTFRQTTIPKALRPHTSYLIAMVNDRPELIWEREEE